MSCLLWVISGHVRLREKASALPLKADILRGDGALDDTQDCEKLTDSSRRSADGG
jgi:hypothetical protein